MRISVLAALLTVGVAVAGCAGPKGDKGDKGDPGPAGPPGKQGEAGKNGAPGREGQEGPPGKNGSDGFRIVRSQRTPTGQMIPASCQPEEVMISAICVSGGSYHGTVETLGDTGATCPDIEGSPQPSALVVCVKR